MSKVWTSTLVYVSDIPGAYGTLIDTPIAFPIIAEQVDDSSRASIEGRFHRKAGYATGHDTPLRQDTFLTGTGGRTGRAFTAVAGTWRDDWKSPYYDTYALLQPDNTAGVTFEIVSTTPTATIEAAEIIVHRGFPPVGDSTVYNASNTFAYLHLNYQGAIDYRISLEYGKAIRLDYSANGGAGWTNVMALNGVVTEKYLQSVGDAVRIRVNPDYYTGELFIEIGSEGELHHALPLSTFQALTGNIRLIGKNGWAGLEYYPLRTSPVTLNSATQNLTSVPHGNASNAYVVSNGLTNSPDGQNVNWSWYSQDGMQYGFSATASLPDAGEGQGSATKPKLSDATLLIPEIWGDRVDGDNSMLWVQQLRSTLIEEQQLWDDNARCVVTSGRAWINNYDNQYTKAFGNFAIEIDANLIDQQGGFSGYYRRCIGVAGAGEEGIDFVRASGINMIGLPWSDKRIMMQVPLGYEVIFDGWCLFSAVRWIARACNIHPYFMYYIPYWPDGPADSSCPYPILSRGTGLNPKWQVRPDMFGWNVLLWLASDNGLPIAPGLSLPYFTGFDGIGQLRFEPYDPQSYPPEAFYSTDQTQVNLNNNVLPVYGSIEVFNSTSQLRSDITLQGLDAITYELAQYHNRTSVEVRKALGFRYPMLERNARYTSDLIQALGDTATAFSSLPSQVVRFKTVFAPWVNVGGTILVYDPRWGVGQFVVTSLTNRWGSDITGRNGGRVCESVIIGRNVTAYPSAGAPLF